MSQFFDHQNCKRKRNGYLIRLIQQSGKREKQKAKIRTDIKSWRQRYRESSEWINSSSWKACAWKWKQRTQKENPDSSSRLSYQWLESSCHVGNVSSQRLVKIWLKLHILLTGGKGIVKTCTIIKKGNELNQNIGSKSLHHFVQTLLVPSVRQNHRSWWGPSRTIQSRRSDRTVLDRMHRICVAIWETCEWPEEWTFSTFIPLPKKGDLKQCTNYRTIALVSHASKILHQIILEAIRVKTETEIADKQVGFWHEKETRDQITNHYVSLAIKCLFILPF